MVAQASSCPRLGVAARSGEAPDELGTVCWRWLAAPRKPLMRKPGNVFRRSALGVQRRPGEAPLFDMPPGLTDAVNAVAAPTPPAPAFRRPGLGQVHPGGPNRGWNWSWARCSDGTCFEERAHRRALPIRRPRATARHPGREAARPTRRSRMANFVTLGPLGTALAADKVRAVLIDEIDKSDLDLPGDLLNVMENGEFPIPVLARATGGPFTVKGADGRALRGRRRRLGPAPGTSRSSSSPATASVRSRRRSCAAASASGCRRRPRIGLTRIVTAHLNSDAAATEHDTIAAFADRSRTVTSSPSTRSSNSCA